LEYQQLILLRDIWWPKLFSIFKSCSFFQHQGELDICGIFLKLSRVTFERDCFHWTDSYFNQRNKL